MQLTADKIQLLSYSLLFVIVSGVMLYVVFAWNVQILTKNSKKSWMIVLICVLCIGILGVPWAIYLTHKFAESWFEMPSTGHWIHKIILGSLPAYAWIVLQMILNCFIIWFAIEYLRKSSIDIQEFRALSIVSASMWILIAVVFSITIYYE